MGQERADIGWERADMAQERAGIGYIIYRLIESEG